MDSNQSSTYLMIFGAKIQIFYLLASLAKMILFLGFLNIVMVLKKFLRVSNLGRRFFPHFLNFDAEKLRGLDVGSNLSLFQDNFLRFSLLFCKRKCNVLVNKKSGG